MPTQLAKPTVRIEIALTVLRELLSPPYAVRFRRRLVGRAGMPKAPVDKYRHLRTRKDNVSSSSQAFYDRGIHAITQAEPEECFPKGYFCICISLARCLHSAECFRRGRVWAHSARQSCELQEPYWPCGPQSSEGPPFLDKPLVVEGQHYQLLWRAVHVVRLES
jgi:hypothetical protein